MIRFDHQVENYGYGYKEKLFNGKLTYKNYPVNLRDINEDYLEDAIIRSFQPFLQIQKPIEKDPNIGFFYKNSSGFIFLDIINPYSKIYNIVTFLGLENDDVYLYYETVKTFKEASRLRKRYREEVEEEEFLQNVLNAMTRLLNTIIKDYTIMSSLVLRNGTGKFIGPAETRIAEFIGADRSIVKDGQNVNKK